MLQQKSRCFLDQILENIYLMIRIILDKLKLTVRLVEVRLNV